MAFKCLCYFVMFKKGPHHHISVHMTVHSESQVWKDHFTAGRESQITHADAQYIYMQETCLAAHCAAWIIYLQSERWLLTCRGCVCAPHSAASQHKAPGDVERQ